MRITSIIATIAVLTLPLPALAQDNAATLADIRQELGVLTVEMQKLTRELSTSGGAQGVSASGSVLERVNEMESELQRLTSKTEELEFRINSVVKDGTNRIGDLEFRICELEKGCDVGSLKETATLGGGAMPAAAAVAPPSKPAGGTVQMAVSEQSDFDRAKAEIDSGSFRTAADLFAAFTEAYPAGPLTAPAHFLRGNALTELGEITPAARSYLDAFSTDPTGTQAPMALLRLGQSLGQLGQKNEACITLGEVSTRFPGGEAASEAASSRKRLGCS